MEPRPLELTAFSVRGEPISYAETITGTSCLPARAALWWEFDTRQVAVEAIKRAEDSDAVIVLHGSITDFAGVSRAFLCDLLERDRQEVAVREGVIELELTPFKILTLKLEP